MTSLASDFDPVALLAERFTRAISAAFPELAQRDIDPLLGPARQAQFGDFQSNAAMPLGKRLGVKPREAAQKIVDHLDVADLCEPLTEQSIAGPGFINVFLKKDTLAELVGRLDAPELGLPPVDGPETVVVDLCGVNLAKQMHVGHLRSTVIGDAIARTLERLGHHVLRQNHVGDWGLPIAMVTAKLGQEAEAGAIDPEKLSLADLNRLYRAAQQECAPDHKGLERVRQHDLGPKAEAELEEQVAGATEALVHAKKTLVKLQAHDAGVVAVWQKIYDITMSTVLATCERLHTRITAEHSAGESSYAELLGPVVEDLVTRGVAEESDGALVVRVEGVKEPCLIRKRDGGYLYATTDVAAIRKRVQELGADRAVYVVDARQSLHFTQAFGAAKKAGYASKPDGTRATLEHAGFGTVLGEDNRPLRTRSGENVKLSDLLDEAVDRAKAAMADRGQDGADADAAERIGIAAIKYADLQTERVRDYVFSFDRMVSFEGNTGPYLLYAVVRLRSILRKAQAEGIAFDGAAPIAIAEPDEKALALTLLRYPGVVRAVEESLEPSKLCQYAYDLATAFSGFFDRCPVLKADSAEIRASRLRLCDLTRRVLEDALEVLGLPTVERM
ncbi:MAG: arginine--tRNA ligase [Planctomycetota bacterium]